MRVEKRMLIDTFETLTNYVMDHITLFLSVVGIAFAYLIIAGEST